MCIDLPSGGGSSGLQKRRDMLGIRGSASFPGLPLTLNRGGGRGKGKEGHKGLRPHDDWTSLETRCMHNTTWLQPSFRNQRLYTSNGS